MRAVGLPGDALGALAAQAAQPVGAQDQRGELLAALRLPEQDAGEAIGSLTPLLAPWGMGSTSTVGGSCLMPSNGKSIVWALAALQWPSADLLNDTSFGAPKKMLLQQLKTFLRLHAGG